MAKRRSTRFSFPRFGCFGGQARAEKRAEDECPVKLHMYDLSQGLARQISATTLGKPIEAIWHTGVVVYGREYYFGGGIQQGQPGRTPYGTPVRVESLGVTLVARDAFEDFLCKIGPRYTAGTYNLLSHNCNNFSDEVVRFLLAGRAGVPSYILELPSEVMNSTLGARMVPKIKGPETSLGVGAVVAQPPEFMSTPAVAVAPTASGDIKPGSTDADDKPEPEKTACNGNGSTVPAPVMADPVTLIQGQETSLHGGAVPQQSQFIPDVTEAMARASSGDIEPRSVAAGEPEAHKEVGDDDTGSTAVPPMVQLAAVQPPPSAAAPVSVAKPVALAAQDDPLAEAKSRAQEEVRREFAAIMATGMARAGEAAALAMRRVMERHGLRQAVTAA
ncbi:hypothetical protein ACP4OV_010662 [Aristida adscensionis]